MKRPTVAELQAEIEALKRRVIELERASPKRDPDEERSKRDFERIVREMDRVEKERITREPRWLPLRPHYYPAPFWLQQPNHPPGTVIY